MKMRQIKHTRVSCKGRRFGAGSRKFIIVKKQRSLEEMIPTYPISRVRTQIESPEMLQLYQKAQEHQLQDIGGGYFVSPQGETYYAPSGKQLRSKYLPMVTSEYKRRRLSPQQKKIQTVMREFYSGKLKSSDGKKVTDRKQALGIAFSEAKQ